MPFKVAETQSLVDFPDSRLMCQGKQFNSILARSVAANRRIQRIGLNIPFGGSKTRSFADFSEIRTEWQLLYSIYGPQL